LHVGFLSDTEEPSQEVAGKNRHAQAKHDSGEGAFAATFAKCEREAANNNGDECESLGDRAGKCRLQYRDGVFPRRSALGLGTAGNRQGDSEDQRPPLGCSGERRLFLDFGFFHDFFASPIALDSILLA
jgi:hypothetical protein